MARNMTETEAAWLAGMLDGEGTLSLYMRKTSRSEYDLKHRVSCYTLRIYNSNKPAIDYIYEITQCGYVREKKQTKYCLGHLKMWYWEVTDIKNLFDICEQLYPYLRIKDVIVENLLFKTRNF